jgi:hypothetical protein
MLLQCLARVDLAEQIVVVDFVCTSEGRPKKLTIDHGGLPIFQNAGTIVSEAGILEIWIYKAAP